MKKNTSGALIDEGTISLSNVKHRSSGGHWKHTVLSVTDDGTGAVTLAYARPDRYEEENKNTTKAYYEIAHGVWSSQTGDRATGCIGIDWEKVASVHGETYAVKDLIKQKGFRWNGSTKSWIR